MSVKRTLSTLPIDVLAGKNRALVPIPLLTSCTDGKVLYPLPLESRDTFATGPAAVSDVVEYSIIASLFGYSNLSGVSSRV